MKRKTDLAARVAREARVSKGAAADQLDRAVHRILSNLKKGQPASLPGLGTFTPGARPKFRFESPARKNLK